MSITMIVPIFGIIGAVTSIFFLVLIWYSIFKNGFRKSTRL